MSKAANQLTGATRRAMVWARVQWEQSMSAADGRPSVGGVAGKGAETRVAQLRQKADTHRENVWLAIAGLGFVVGAALVTAVWLAHATFAAAPAPERGVAYNPGWFNDAIMGGLLLAGILFIAVGLYVLASFF